MLKLKVASGLIVIAFELIRIAVCSSPTAVLLAPRGWSTSEAILERPRERFSRAEANGNGSGEHRETGLRRESHGCHFNSAAAQIVSKGFTHPRSEESVEVERRKVGDFRQRCKVERLIELAVNVIENSVHAPLILRATISRAHSTRDLPS